MTATRYTDADVARHAEMLANRVKKSFAKLHPRFERASIGAFRLYDWDIPEVRAVVDWYEGHLVCAEYAREQTAHLDDYSARLGAACAAALSVPAANVHTKERRTRPQTGDRYERLARTEHKLHVREGDLKFYVNLDDFLDTGLFCDHRQTRARVRAMAAGKRVLNLFAYTGSFSVYAAAGRATQVVTVDASRTYLDWAEANFALNEPALAKLAPEPPALGFVRDDARDFLTFEARRKHRYDIIVCDPPSFSTGRDRDDFDVQRDHVALARAALAVLDRDGTLFFSTNHQRFEPQWGALTDAVVLDISAETVPPEYRNRGVHRCFSIRYR